MKNQEHNLPLMVCPEIQSALMAYGVKNGVSTLYAAQQNVIKNLYNEGLLDKETFERVIAKFRRRLVPERKPTFEEIKEKQKLDEQAKVFSLVLEQWNLPHNPGWQENWIRQAEKYKDTIPSARMLLDLGAIPKC